MPKRTSTHDLVLHERPTGMSITHWVYHELREAILAGRLPPGARLPSTREMAQQWQMARSTVVTAFAQLRAEGYVHGTVGAGTVVAATLPEALLQVRVRQAAAPAPLSSPAVLRDCVGAGPAGPLARLCRRRARRALPLPARPVPGDEPFSSPYPYGHQPAFSCQTTRTGCVSLDALEPSRRACAAAGFPPPVGAWRCPGLCAAARGHCHLPGDSPGCAVYGRAGGHRLRDAVGP
jgi:hypothetical protein